MDYRSVILGGLALLATSGVAMAGSAGEAPAVGQLMTAAAGAQLLPQAEREPASISPGALDRGATGAKAAPLPAVEVFRKAGKPPARQMHYGSPETCFAYRNYRGWNMSPKGLVVEVSRRRNAGYKFYRLKVEGNCRSLGSADTLYFASGTRSGMVCDNPGDRVIGARAHVVPRPRGASCFITKVQPIR